MKLALNQMAGTPCAPEANLRQLRETAHEAANGGAELLILPEMWLTGYNIAERVFDLAEPADGPTAHAVARIARETGVAILYGYPERAGEEVYNAAQLVAADGELLVNARKAHLFGSEERRLFTAGDTGLAVVDYAGLRVGIMICYDLEFPEAARSLALSGAELIAVPTALMEPYSFVATHLAPTRAYENVLFIAYANRCGREGNLEYVGRSCVCAPDGSDVARAGVDETLLFAELDLSERAECEAITPFLRERRPEIYTRA